MTNNPNLTSFPHPSPELYALTRNTSVTFVPDTLLWWPSYSYRQESGLGFIGDDFFYSDNKFGVRYFVPRDCVLASPEKAKEADAIPDDGDLDAKVLKMSERFAPEDWKVDTLRRFVKNGGTKTLTGVIHFSKNTEGPPSFVHGGATFTAFDQIVGVMVHYYAHQAPHMTLNLTIHYRKPMPLGSTQFFHLRIAKTEGRKVFVDGCIFDPSLASEDEAGDSSEAPLDVAQWDFSSDTPIPAKYIRAKVEGTFYRLSGVEYLEQNRKESRL
ncbi:Thioesterase super member 4 [Gaertneriomyces sp. JEL0708]|nr:Thioesterase super member 4 [Gaertneriomyces sp. JEL0708]